MPETVRFGLAAMPVSLDPRHATDAASARIIRLLYDRLVDFDDQALPVPGIADWERIAPDEYRFVLHEPRPRFVDGSRLSAEDVAATYRSVLDARTGSAHRASLQNVREVRAIGSSEIVFRLHGPDPLFPGRLVIGIMPRAAADSPRARGRSPIGSGPFEMIGWPTEGELRLRRRADGQAFAFVGVPDPTVRVLKLIRGELDLIQNDLPPELVAWLEGREEARVMRRQGTTFAYLGFNLRDPVTARPEVRRAIGLAIDREALIRHILGGAARPAGSLLPPEHWAGIGDPGLAFDPAAARRLVAAAEAEGGAPIRILYKTSTDPVRVRLATAIRQQLGEVGIEVDLRSYDWGTFYGDIRAGNFQAYSLSWVGVKLPEIFRYAFHSDAVPPEGANRGFFSSAAADRLIEAVEAQETAAAQQTGLARLQALLLKELPYVPLWYEDHVAIVRAGLTGYRLAADGNYDSLSDVVRREPSP